MNANFNFITREMLMFLVVCLFLMLVFVIIIFVLEKNKNKILKTRLALSKAILNDDLDDLLKIFNKILLDVFDDAGINFKTRDFLAEKLKRESFLKIISIYKNIGGPGRLEAKKVFEQAFSEKKNIFWANLYFIDFINNEGRQSDEFMSFFEFFEINYFKDVWTLIYKDFQRFKDNMLHASNKELDNRLSKEIQRIKVLLGN